MPKHAHDTSFSSCVLAAQPKLELDIPTSIHFGEIATSCDTAHVCHAARTWFIRPLLITQVRLDLLATARSSLSELSHSSIASGGT
jgi:hypothetical protein